MKELFTLLVLLAALNLGNCFTKYGRSCKDIGCPSTQECVMESDPCSYYQRQGDCGPYPTCKRKSGTAKRTCSTFVCPPSQVCKMDGDTPKCVNDASKSGHVGYDTHAANAPLEPNAPPPEGGNLYPQIPKGETTPRPNIRPVANGGSGYQGGQIGSGYPGYPQQTGGYPQQNGGYPQQNGGYPQQNGGYPQNGYQGQGGYQGYPQGGYQGYPQGGYNGQGTYQYPVNPYQQVPPQKSAGSSITDKIKDGLKTIGTNFLKDYLTKAFSGGGRS